MTSSHSPLMSLEQALEKILDSISPIEASETLGIMDAFARILAEPIKSPLNVPP